MYHINTYNSTFNITTRIKLIIADILEEIKKNPGTKLIIFSQYPESLESAMKMFMNYNTIHKQKEQDENVSSIDLSVKVNEDLLYDVFTCVLVGGKETNREREENLRRFNEDPSCNVCFLSTGSAATGLTLTVAHLCYMLEPTHNAAEEAQALNRVHRIGQTQAVRCVIFYANDSIEERVLALRQSQGQLTEILANSAENMDDDDDMTMTAGRGAGISSSSSKRGPNDDDDEDEEFSPEERFSRRKGSKGTKEQKNKSTIGGTSGFFNASQLKNIFGLTEERRQKVSDER